MCEVGAMWRRNVSYNINNNNNDGSGDWLELRKLSSDTY